MKFIIPKNYNYNMKLLGFINYSTAIIDVLLGVILYFLLNIIFKNFSTKMYFFIGFYLPVVLFSIFGVNGENIFCVLKIIVKFIYRNKIYVYSKKDKDNVIIKK